MNLNLVKRKALDLIFLIKLFIDIIVDLHTVLIQQRGSLYPLPNALQRWYLLKL